MDISDEKELYCTHNQNVLSLPAQQVNGDLSPSCHEQMDTRLF